MAGRGESARIVPISSFTQYGESVTETPEQPTLADVLAVMNAGFAQLMTEQAKTNAKLDEVRDELRGEIRATEANLVSRINSVQEVIRSVKADTAAHLNDPTAHHRHAA